MTTVQFYHLITTPLERALPKLLEKAYGGGFKTLLVAESDERVEQLNQLLWTYDPNSFLPHGSVQDGDSEQQPILLATSIEQAAAFFSPRLRGEPERGDRPAHHGTIGEGEFSPPASGGVKRLLLVTDGTLPGQPEQFERILDIFDGNTPEAVEKARSRWKEYKNSGHSLSYLRQTESGGWEQKMVA